MTKVLGPDPQGVLGAPQSDKTIPTLPRSGQEHGRTLWERPNPTLIFHFLSRLWVQNRVPPLRSGTPEVPSRPAPPTGLFFHFLLMYSQVPKNFWGRQSECTRSPQTSKQHRSRYIYICLSISMDMNFLTYGIFCCLEVRLRRDKVQRCS